MVDPLALFDLRGRVAIITGASSGLGARFARVLNAVGAKVIIAARRRDRLDSLAEAMDDCHAVACDVTDGVQRSELVKAAIDRFGGIDILVNNAGTNDSSVAIDDSPARFGRVLDVNLVAPYALTELVAATMIKRDGGAVVNIASVLGVVGAAPLRERAYAASKAGIINLTRQLASEWAHQGVRVNALTPGWFPSEMTSAMLAEQRGLEWIEKRTPMRRVGRSHELDGALLFLASDASSFVTGSTLVVDGGWTIV